MLRERISNPDVERVLCGKLPENTALTPLVPMLSAFRDVAWPAPADDAVAEFASAAATIVRSATPVAPLKLASPGRSRFLAPTFQRGLAAGLASVLLVSGLAGVAVASDDAAPGDFLYGIDRALESVGVGAGGAPERISEARALIDRGQIDEAVGHAFRAVGDKDAEPPNAQLHEEIAAMLEDPTLDGKDFGQSVAEMARLLEAKDAPLSRPGQTGTGASEPVEPGPGQPGPGNSDDAFTPPSDNTPGAADDPPTAPPDPPGKSEMAPGKADTAPGKTESSPGKSDEKKANSPTRS